MIKKFFIVFSLIFATTIVGSNLVLAQEVSPSPEISNFPIANPRVFVKPITPFVRNIEAKELKQSLSITEIEGFNLCRESEECDFDSDGSYSEVLINAGKITDIGESIIEVSVFGYNYKIDISKAKLVRQYWVESELDEFSVGDVVNVFGYLDQSDYYLVHGKTVRDITLQKKISVLKGLIGFIDNVNKTFVLQTINNGDQTVMVDSNTKIIESEPIFCIQMVGINCPFATSTLVSFEDLAVGEAVVVRGVWNQDNHKIVAELIISGYDGRPLFNNLEKLQNQIQERMENVLNSSDANKGGLWQKIESLFDRLRGK